MRLSGEVPSDAQVPTACGGAARSNKPAAETNVARKTPNASRVVNRLIATLPPCPSPNEPHVNTRDPKADTATANF